MLQVHKQLDRLCKGQASLLFHSSDRCVLGQGDGSQSERNTTLGSRKDERRKKVSDVTLLNVSVFSKLASFVSNCVRYLIDLTQIQTLC